MKTILVPTGLSALTNNVLAIVVTMARLMGANIMLLYPVANPMPKTVPLFALQLRVPDWCSAYTAPVGGQSDVGKAGQLLAIDRCFS